MIDKGAHEGVILIGNFLSSTGGKRSVCEDLAHELQSRGWETTCASDRTRPIAKLQHILETVWSQRHRYSVAQIDVFSGKAFIWALAACLLLRTLSRPYVLTLHGGNLPKFALKWRQPLRWIMKHAAAVTAPSNYLVREFMPLRPDLQLLPNGMRLEGYPFRLRSSVSPHLIWVRSFHEMYNPVMAVDTVAALIGRYRDIHLTMIGPDRGDGSLERTRQRIEEHGLTQTVTIIPGVAKSEIPAILNQADIFLNTTNIDNAPVTVYEALACGLCVVSTDVGGIPDILTNRKNAILVSRGDIEAMSRAIDDLLSGRIDCAGLSLEAHRTAHQSDWNVVLPRWISILRASQDRYTS
ncbi:glycosyltransferase family 4 protein [Microvirga sp. CF3062]|uniref:glycosyltransferase family 4 protein n=1 Tax=Microvirga sp. CF3062 TaxID=3110182 RepID=UPI002E772A8D|nr:glycosyltransferase family 4 protein [Microvirga sp. CF3062]MEE1657663.1 glycosyltransferase family 4 protein [Microvirga sp. CF3062]